MCCWYELLVVSTGNVLNSRVYLILLLLYVPGPPLLVVLGKQEQQAAAAAAAAFVIHSSPEMTLYQYEKYIYM